MPRFLSRLITPVEAVFDKTVSDLKWRYDLWDDLRIRPYLGYGTPEEVRLTGRVLEGKHVHAGSTDSVWTNISRTLQRIENDQVRGATVRLIDGDTVLDVQTDPDGYFSFQYGPTDPARPWHEVRLELIAPVPEDPVESNAAAFIRIPCETADFAIISDMDDTVVKTDATNKLKYAGSVLLNNAQSRTPFPGIGAFYRALEGGRSGERRNPFFYVSSSPWNMFGQFHGFLRYRDIPEGPLFLKDFGIDEDKFIRSGHRSHKIDYVRTLLGTYPDRSFVLIGDSGQEDAEIYARVVREHPGRVLAVYIRDVSGDLRDRKVRQIASEVEALGVPMRLVEDSAEAARHAAEIGLIPDGAVPAVEAETVEEVQPAETWWKRALSA